MPRHRSPAPPAPLVSLWTAVLAVLVLAGCGGEAPGRGAAAAPERLVLSFSEQPLSAQVYVAEARGLFAREGLDVTLLRRSSGKAALDDLVAGRADVATASETPILFAALDERRICILSTIAVTERNLALVGRRDRGLLGPEDLRGKRVGVSPRTNSEFFLDVLLIYSWMRSDELTIVDLAPEQMVPALAAGRVDAVSVWEPHLSEAQRRLGRNAVTFTGQGIYRWTWNLVTGRELARQRPEAMRRLLRALAAATREIAAEPAAARLLVAERLGLPPAQLADIWSKYQFDLQLDQSLLLNLEGQTRWAMRKRYADRPTLPNYLDSICPEALVAVAPSAVTLIHRGSGR
jgi:NitT/TauT family transport system substrate-binding protein